MKPSTLGALVLAAAIACRRAPEPPESSVEVVDNRIRVAPPIRARMGIALGEAALATRTERLQANAILELDETRTSRVGAKVEGTLVRTVREAGERVPEGALLAEIHSHVGHDLLATYRKALAEERRREQELHYARQAEARSRRLLADKAAAAQEVELAETARVSAEQHLAMAKAESQRALHDLEFFGIDVTEAGSLDVLMPATSPRAGTVMERLVSEGATVVPGTPLFVVSDLSRLWAVVEIDESNLSGIALGLRVTFQIAAFPGETFEGPVTFIADAVNPETRRVVVRASIENPEGRLKVHMFATANLELGPDREVLVIPSEAIQEVEGRTVVFVEVASGEYEMRAVELGDDLEGRSTVKAGLASGERVVTAGSFLLKSELQRAALAEEE
ncbi:MAG TPA: efflux RND transporter periplasmic adaptor subunit [Vicinamibacteria bacterium]